VERRITAIDLIEIRQWREDSTPAMEQRMSDPRHFVAGQLRLSGPSTPGATADRSLGRWPAVAGAPVRGPNTRADVGTAYAPVVALRVPTVPRLLLFGDAPQWRRRFAAGGETRRAGVNSEFIEPVVVDREDVAGDLPRLVRVHVAGWASASSSGSECADQVRSG
jgi:hypothetical protein